MLNNKYSEFVEDYKNAIYVVMVSPAIRFRIGQKANQMTEFLFKHQSKDATLITACNPRGIKIPEVENRIRMASLEQDIQALKLPYYPAYGASEDESWLEDSYFILGVTKTIGTELAKKYEQNAIVWINQIDTPSLIWIN